MNTRDHPTQIDPPDDEVIRFSRVLRPHRSSSDRAVKIVSRFVLFLFIPTGTAFLIAGAWPVFGLMGLEAIALIFALHYNHKVGSAFEAITLTEREFRFSRVDHWGKRKHWTFQPQWLQFRLDAPSQQLIAGTHGKRIVIGKFLNLEEKEALCDLLQSEVKRLGDIRHAGSEATC